MYFNQKLTLCYFSAYDILNIFTYSLENNKQYIFIIHIKFFNFTTS